MVVELQRSISSTATLIATGSSRSAVSSAGRSAIALIPAAMV